VTVLEIIQRSAEFLGKKGVDSPRLQAELLLAHVLKLPRMRLYLDFERRLATAEIDSLRELVRRRSQREPLQHIVGSSSFCGLELIVNRHVLVPRPETELLAEHAWEFLKSLASGEGGTSLDGAAKGPAALDYGTGSGCLAIALAVHCPDAAIHALEISDDALNVARQNALHHGLGERIRFWQGDGLSALPAESRFDLIVGNPPYIPSMEIDFLQPEVRDFDPRQALDGGPDGLDHYRRLAVQARPLLRKRGKLMLEIGACQSESVSSLFAGQNWVVERLVEDYTRCPRIVIAHDKSEP
jgi:release factor glutamine methyltransferase